MTKRTLLSVTDRRTLLIDGARAIAGIGALIGVGPQAAFAKTVTWQSAMKEILKGATPVKEKLVLTMPEIAENGNVVPITINGDSASGETARITDIHVFATDNPFPYVAHFSFSENSGKVEVTSRMRLAKSQKVVAVAALSDGRFLMAESFVKVTIGGCGG